MHKELIDLHQAVHEWWVSKRPNLWTEQQHLENPDVNCSTNNDTRLGLAYACVVKRKNSLPIGIYEGVATGHQVTVNVPAEGYSFIINTEDAVKGLNVPVSVRVSLDQANSRKFTVTYGKPLGHVLNRVEQADGRVVAPSGLVFYQDPPEA